jgi:4-alpha-glucanotransferase
MGPRISLALAIHNHQPVGNFGWVFADVFDVAYEPMVAALERHPGVRLSLHYTGPLLDWLRTERPEFVERVATLVARDQVEILGGGYYEPVLASLPERDRIGQLSRMSAEVEASFGRRPRGAWLAERVWEPDVPTSLVSGGYEWTILDDSHFRAAAIREEDLWGPYSTDDQGKLVRVFGTERGLRYRIPFRDVDEVIAYLGEHATDDGSRVGTMGDDGEKFGAWPTTWEHCWGERRWVERFFDALEQNADWLATTTPSAWLAEHPPIGRVYIPTGSYEEMGEWALPPDESRDFGRTLQADRAEGRPEVRWMRGAFWRNFQVKYREINDLHKQMLRTSDAVETLADGATKAIALDHLYRGQSNDCYWHGLFGGIYINHMRLATCEHLIAAEDLADEANDRSHVAEVRDLDLDGRDDVRMATPGQTVSVDLTDGGGIGAWDIRAVRHALCSVMRRRPEAYHQILRDHDAAIADGSAGSHDAEATSIHDIVRTKEAGLSALIRHDPYERRSGLVRFLAPDTQPESWAAGEAVELGDAVEGRFGLDSLELDRLDVSRAGWLEADGRTAAIWVSKTILLGGDRRAPTLELIVAVDNRSTAPINALFGVEWTLMFLGGGGNPSAWLEVDGVRGGHDGRGEATGISTMGQGNDWVGIALETTLSEPANLWWAPVETITNSEAGFERVYQGAGLLFWWPLSLAAGESRTVSVRHVVSTARDRRLDEIS